MNMEETKKMLLDKFEADKKIIEDSQTELKALEGDIKTINKIIILAKLLPKIEGSTIEGDEKIINYCSTLISLTEEDIKTTEDSIKNLKSILAEKTKKMKKLEALQKQTEELLKAEELLKPVEKLEEVPENKEGE